MAGYTYTPGNTSVPMDPASASPLVPTLAPGDSITNYKPHNSTGWIITLVVLLVAGIGGMILVNNLPQPEVIVTETPPPPTSYTTESRTGGMAFAEKDLTGYWRITDTKWGTSGVTLTVEVMVDTGILFYDFYAYAVDDLTQLEQILTSPTDLIPGFVGPGESITGTVTFETSRQSLQLIMVSRGQTQLSALLVDE